MGTSTVDVDVDVGNESESENENENENGIGRRCERNGGYGRRTSQAWMALPAGMISSICERRLCDEGGRA